MKSHLPFISLAISIIFIIVDTTTAQANSCGTYCTECSINTCKKCENSFSLNYITKTCTSDCSSTNSYLYEDKQECMSICPYGYNEDLQYHVCTRNIECPQLTELGNQFETIIDARVVDQTIVIFQYSQNKNNYYISLFNPKNFLIMGTLAPLQSSFEKVYYDPSINQLIISTASNITYWSIQDWKSKSSLNLTQYENHILHISYLDQEILIAQDTTYNKFKIIYHSTQNTPDDSFHETNIQGKIDIMRLFSDSLFFQIIGSKGFYMRSLSSSAMNQDSTLICEQYTPQSYPVALTSNNQKIIFFAGQTGNIGTWNQINGCRMILLEQPISASQILIIEVDSTNNKVKLLTLNSDSVAYLKINLSQDTIEESNVFNINSPVSFQYIQQQVYVIEGSGQQSILQIQQGKLVLLCSQTIAKHNKQKYLTTLYLQNTLYTIYTDSIASYDFSLLNACSITFSRQLSNLKPYQSEQRVQINGVLLDSNFQDQVLTYNKDGSIRIYQKNLINQRFQLSLFIVQFHPTCNFKASTGNSAFQCYQIINAIYDSKQYVVVYIDNQSQYFASTWLRDVDTFIYKSDFKLVDQKRPLLILQIMNGMFLIGNKGQLRVHNFSDGLVQKDLITEYYFAAFDNIYNQNQIIVIFSNKVQSIPFNSQNPTNNLDFSTIFQNNPTRYTYFTKATYYPPTRKLVFICTIGVEVITFDGSSPSWKYIDCSLIRDFCYHPFSKQIFLQQLEYKRVMILDEVNSNTLQSILLAGTTNFLTCGLSSSRYFYYFVLVPLIPTLQNTVYVILMPNMKVVFQQSYKDKISGLYLNESELTLYITFENGGFLAGRIFLDDLITAPTLSGLKTLLYAPTKRYLAVSALNTNSQGQLTIINSLNLSVQSQVTISSINSIEFSILDEISDVIALSSGKNIFIWKSAVTPVVQPTQLQQLHKSTVNNLIIDGYKQILISVSNDFQMFVWDLQTSAMVIQIDYHLTDSIGIDNFKIDNIFLDKVNNLIISYNKKRVLYIQNYITLKQLKVNLNQYNQIINFYVIPEKLNIIMITQNTNFAINLFTYNQDSNGITFNEIKMIPINHQQTPIKMNFINNRILSFENSKVIVTDFQTFEVLYEIQVVNPKINDLVVSLKQNLLVIWSDCSTFCSPKVQIYNFLNGQFVIDVPYYNQIEEGLVLKVVLDEDTNTLIIVKYPSSVIIQFFNIETLQPSGIIYSQDVPLVLPIQYVYLIRETNNLVFTSGQSSPAQSIQVYQIEQRIGQYKLFIQLLRNQQAVPTSTDMTNFFVTDAFSEAWSYNNQNNQVACITKMMSNPLNTQVKQIFKSDYYVFVILFDSIVQLDLTLKQINAVNIQVDQFIYTGDSLYTSDMRGVISFFSSSNLKKNDITFTLDSRVLFIILVSSTSEILAVSTTNKLYRINTQTGVNNIWMNSSVKIINLLYENAKNIVIIVGDDGNIYFFDQNIWKNSSSQTILLTSGKQLPSPYNPIRQVILDTKLGQILVLNEIPNKTNLVNVYGYTFATIDTFSLTGIVNLGTFSSISKLPFVNIKISNSNYLMFSGYTITWINRDTSGFKINRFIRDRTYFKDIIDVVEIDNLIIKNTFFILEPGAITLYFSVSSTELNKLYQHQCSFPKLLNYNYIVRQAQGDIEIQIIGACGGGLFNDKVYIRDPQSKLSTLNSCYIESTTEYQYQFDNKLEDVQFSLDMLKMNPSLLVIEQQQQTDFSSLDIGSSSKNRTTLLRYRDVDNLDQVLNIKDDYFSDYPYEKLQISGFTLNVKNVQKQIVFSPKINQIVFQNVDIQFGNTKENPISPFITFNFENLNSVVLKSLTISSQSLVRKSPLLTFSNIETGVFIDNLEINDLTLDGEIPTLIAIKNTTQVQINKLKLNNVQFSTTDQKQYFIVNLQNVISFQLTNSNFATLSIRNTQLLIVQCLGVRNTELQSIIMSTINGISLIELSNYFFEGDQEMLVNDSKVSITDLQVDDVQNLKQSFIFLNNTYSSSLKDSKITEVKCSTCSGGVINILKGNQHIIKDSQFDNNMGRKGGVLGIIECQAGILQIISSKFENNNANYSGGALYIENSKVNIVGSTIQQNKAMIGGGLRYDSIKPTIDKQINSRMLQSIAQSTVIQNNQAEVFGNNMGSYLYSMRIIQSGLSQMTEQQLFNNSTWQNSLQNKVMNAYHYQDFRSGDSLAIYIQLLDEEGNPVFIDSQQIKDKTYDPDLIQEISGFQAKSQPLFNAELKVFGQFQTDYSFFNKTNKAFLIETKIVSNPEKSNILLIQYSSLISNIEVTGKLFSQHHNKLLQTIQINNLLINLTLLQLLFVKLSIGDQKYSVIVIDFRKCVQGEVYQKLDQVYSCNKCPDGQYSLSEPNINQQSCSRCPGTASKCYENRIILKEGYWRSDNESETIIECSRKLANCVPDEEHRYCKQGNYGPLCEECDTQGELWGDRYQTDGSLNCNSCKKLYQGYYFTMVMVKLLFVFLFLGISVAASIYDSKSIILGYYLRKMKVICISKSCYLNSSSYGLKNLTTFLQMTSIIYEVVFQQFPTGSTYVSTLIGEVIIHYLKQSQTFILLKIGMPLTNVLHSLDCSLSTKLSFPIIYLRTLWGMGSAFIYFFTVSISLFIYGLIRKQSKKILFYHGMIYTYFFLQSNVTYVLFSMMSCRKIGDEYYVLADISHKCTTEVHGKFLKLIGIPGIVIWCVLIPLFLLFKMKQTINQQDSSISRETFGVLYNHYKKEYYYWEIVKFCKKAFLNGVLVFYIKPLVNKFVFALLLQLLFLILLSKTKPHFLRNHYIMDYTQEFVLTVKMVFCIFIQSKEKLEEQQRLLYFEIGLSSLFQIFFLLLIMKEYIKKRYVIHYMRIKKFIFDYIPKFLSFFKNSSMEQKSNMKHLFLWKKLRIYVRNLIRQEHNQTEIKDQVLEQKQQAQKQFKSYRSKLEDIGKTMRESSLATRKVSGELLLLSPLSNSWRQNSEANNLLRYSSQQSAQFILQSQRIVTDQQQITEDNNPFIVRLDTEQVSDVKAKLPLQSNFTIHQQRLLADVSRQSEDFLSPKLIKFDSDQTADINLLQQQQQVFNLNTQSDKQISNNEISLPPNLKEINDSKVAQQPQTTYISYLQKRQVLQKQSTEEIQSPQLIRFDSEQFTENQSPVKLLQQKSEEDINQVKDEKNLENE